MVPQYGGDVLEKLQKIRKMSGKCDTHGINDDLIKNFLENDPFLSMAIDEAERNYSINQKTITSASSLSERMRYKIE